MRCRWILICLALLSCASFANSVYMKTLPDGSVVVSDQPEKGAKELKTDPLTVANRGAPEQLLNGQQNTAAVMPTSSQSVNQPSQVGYYRQIKAVFPVTTAAFPYTIAFEILLAPPLKDDDNILLLVDNTPIAYVAKIMPPKDQRSSSLRYIVPVITRQVDPNYPAIISDDISMTIDGYLPDTFTSGEHTWQVIIRNSNNETIMTMPKQTFSALWHHIPTSSQSAQVQSGSIVGSALNVLLNIARNLIVPG